MTRVASVECTSCQDCVAACPIKDCLAVRLAPARRPLPLLRPAFAVTVAMAVYLGVTLGFRVAGHWRGSVSEAEFAARLPHLDSPLYTHVGGLAASETAEAKPRPVASHRVN
jgi:ferredoxin